MLSINDLENSSLIVLNGDPYAVLEVRHQHIGRGGSNVQARLKNLRTGQVLERNFKPADSFDEAEIEKKKTRFLYEHRGTFWFVDSDNPKNRFSLPVEILSGKGGFLKQNLDVIAVEFSGNVIAVELPIKIDYKVTEAPPAVRGNTAQGGTKTIVLENGLKVNAPLFINDGDIVRVNTETGEYIERVEKA
ncbi:MAG: elongation factor P [Parcubacteria group bacterium]|nr:elongation factor P [Parcubacteria group bacterium]